MVTRAAMSLITQNETIALTRLAQSLQEIPEVLKIVVFGSRVRGDFRESSDMDVMVVLLGMELESKNTVIRILHDVELEYDVPISPVIYTKNEYEMNKKLGSSFVKHVENEGIVLYDSEHRRKGRSLAIQT